MSRRRPRRICLFGTSANPPTGSEGHAGVVAALVGLKRFDEVRVLPVYRHTFASKRDQLLGFDHRVAMSQLAMEGLSSSKPSSNDESENDAVVHNTTVVVSRAEEDSFRRMLVSSNAKTDEEKALLRVGTADLLEMLLEKENDASYGAAGVEFSFCLGADTFLDLTDWKWKRSRDVLRLLEGRLVVVNRKQQEETPNDVTTTTTTMDPFQERIAAINASPLANGNILLLDVPSLGNVSSSKVRNASNKDLVRHMLCPKVLEYVIVNKLYGFGE